MFLMSWLRLHADQLDYAAAVLGVFLAVAVTLFAPRDPQTKRPVLSHPLVYGTIICCTVIIIIGLYQIIF